MGEAETGWRSRENWTRLRCRKNLLSEKAVGDSRGKGWKRTPAAAREEVEEQPHNKRSPGYRNFWKEVTRILLIAVGIGAIFFFGGLLVLALLWIYRKLREWHARSR